MSIAAIYFVYGTVILPREHFKQSNLSRAVFILKHQLQPFIISSGLCLFEEMQLPYFFKMLVFFTQS